VLTWRPDAPTLHVSVDMTSTIADRMEAPEGTGEKIKRSMKTSSGTGNIEFTECAALVFPKLDELAVATGDHAETKREKIKHYKGFAGTYFDRRAQAKHVSAVFDHLRSSLSTLIVRPYGLDLYFSM
jgi:hypothetical protein